MSARARGILAALAVLAAAGCDQTAWLLYKTIGPFVPAEKVEAEFDFDGRSLLVLVDTNDPDLGAEFPRLQARLADEVSAILTREEAVGPIVPGHSVDLARRREPDFPAWPVDRVGRYFNVDYVLHVVVYDFRVRESPASSVLDGYAETTLRVVSPETGKQLWPVLATARQVTARTLPDVDPVDDPVELEKILIEGLSDKIARHFFTYKKEDMPLRPKVE